MFPYIKNNIYWKNIEIEKDLKINYYGNATNRKYYISNNKNNKPLEIIIGPLIVYNTDYFGYLGNFSNLYDITYIKSYQYKLELMANWNSNHIIEKEAIQCLQWFSNFEQWIKKQLYEDMINEILENNRVNKKIQKTSENSFRTVSNDIVNKIYHHFQAKKL